MRILYIIKSIAPFGGVERILSYKMNFLADNLGYEIYLLTYEQGNHPFSFPLSSKIKHTDLNVRFFTRHNYNLLKRILLYYKMRSIFKSRINKKVEIIKPDIIVALTDSYTLLDILMQLSEKAKIIVESHLDRNGTIKQNNYLNNPLLFIITKQYDNYILRSLKKCDAFVSLTEGDYKQWIGVPNKSIIPNPISFIPKDYSSLRNKRVISVGRLEPQKGFDMLISAWKIISDKHNDWILDIYGNGGLCDSLEKQIINLNLSESCIIHPATENIEEKYMESSIYVMSSLYEGFGLVLIEAMSFGVPCVSFDCPYGPSDIISNGKDGILVEPNNINKLADAICSLIENEDKRLELGNEAKIKVQRFSADNIMPLWDKLFHSLV